jgi:hypothetical protein
MTISYGDNRDLAVDLSDGPSEPPVTMPGLSRKNAQVSPSLREGSLHRRRGRSHPKRG